MAIKTFINGQQNGVITFKGNTEPCAVYVNGERQDNISYIPQSVEGVNTVEYSSEYKKNIRTMQIDGNTEQFQGTFAPQNIVIPTSYVIPSSAPIIVSATPITVPNGARLTLTANKTGSGNISSLPSGFVILVSNTQDDIANNYTEVLEDYGTPQYSPTPKVSGEFYIGIANFLTGGLNDNPQAYWDFLRANYTFTLSTEGNTVPNPDYPQPIHNANDTRLPSEYQEVTYIESTGTQYINTGVVPNNETGFSIDVSFPDVSTDMFRFGCRKDSGNTRFILGTNNNMYFGFGVTINQTENKWAIVKNTFYNAKLNFLNSRVANLNDKNDVALGNLGVTDMVYSIIMFGRNSGGSITSSAQTIKACQISQGTSIIRDFVPCYRKSDNKVGMYDLVNGVFYTNAGTGEFVKGNNVGMSLELSVNGNTTTIALPPSVTVGGETVPLRFAKYINADYLLINRTNGTVKYYQYSTVGDPTKPLSEQAENNPPLEYDITSTDLGQALLNLPTENQTNIITITSTPSVSKLSVNYAKYGGHDENNS